MLPMR